MAVVAVTSDLHLGITSIASIEKLAADIAAAAPDAVVLAGDLVERPAKERLPVLLDLFRRSVACPIAICAGNHDLWTDDGAESSEELFFKTLPRIAKDHGCTWLDESSLVLSDSKAIAGSIGWYDYSDRSPVTKLWLEDEFKYAKATMHNDGVFIRWRYSDPAFARIVGDALCERLRILESDAKIRSVLVCTHVPAFIDLSEIMAGDDPVMRSFFSVPTLGERLLAFGKVATIVSGHTHREVKPQRRQRIAGSDLILATIGSDYYHPSYQLFQI